MTLLLNETEITGDNMKVSATLSISGQDMSGQSSYTDTAETGDKPKQLTVRLGITFVKIADLKQLITLAEAKDENGSRQVYNIINNTAAAMSIRQVKFEGDLTVNEDYSHKMWSVSFKLTEKRSVPELKESRQAAKQISDQAAAGTDVVEGAAVSDEAVPDEVELSTFEKVLQYAENALAEDEQA